MSGETETLDLPGDRRSLLPEGAGLLLLAKEGDAEIPNVVELPPGVLVIGREPPPGGLAIRQNAVSRLHARITPKSGGFVVSDLGSRNGIIVSGRRVEEAVLADGDLLHIGNAIFKFVEAGVKTFAAPSAPPPGFEDVVAGPSLARIIADLDIVARTDLSILLLGETGTGKDVFARAVHAASKRPGRFVALNCAAIPATLLEAELFGAKRGAFTGAERDREGLVRAADRGTLFLDEIGDMPLEAQSKVLRFIETKEVVPLGATAPERSDARLVCATHRDLPAQLAQGRFRGDLLARIRQHSTVLPSLRERKEDLVALFDHFLVHRGKSAAKVDFRALVMLLHYDWPFNVRELEAVARRAAALASSGSIGERELPDEIRAFARDYGAKGLKPVEPSPASRAPLSGGEAPSAEEIKALLTQHGGNVAALARHYDKDRAQVHRWLRRYGIVPDDFR